jgi:mono/diheme cytochrome c family protein
MVLPIASRRLSLPVFPVLAKGCPVNPATLARTGVLLCCAAFGLVPSSAFAAAAEVTEPAATTAELSFEKHIWPIFRAHCFDCHGATSELKGGLDLRQVRLQQRGGESGAALVPGDAASSLLWQRIASDEMPPGAAKVTPAEKQLIQAWIASGAGTARPEPESIAPGLGITPEERAYWAFQPITRPAAPTVTAAERVRSPIDAFALHKLEAMSPALTFSADADDATLIRRLTLDLIGLPPTYEQVQAYVADPSPEKYQQLVNRLLDSPQYGERWARHWLDVAGYADSDGASTVDRVREFAYKYRDYVIRAFNADRPLDQFIIEQLAGDELIAPPYKNMSDDQIEKLVATGFLRMAADPGNDTADLAAASQQVVADSLKIVSTALLGLSVGCAQCHDHRYDPIPQADYYGLRAVFEPAYDPNHWLLPPQRLISLYTDADHAHAAEVEARAQVVLQDHAAKQAEFIAATFAKQLASFPEELQAPLKAAFETPEKDRSAEQTELLKKHPSANITPGVLYQYNPEAAEELKKLMAQVESIRKEKKPNDFISPLTEPANATPAVTYLFHRGDYRQKLQEIGPADLQIASPDGQRASFASDDPNVPTSGRRLAFARWLVSGQHPLVARVLVNRVWMHHFGRGLVNTPSEFGRLGELPTHPELLDWLATELMQNGWSLKHLHRVIVQSTAYRQSSQISAAAEQADADGRWLSRYPVRRLEAEAVRDSILAVSGALDLTPFGPPIPMTNDDSGQVIEQGEPRRRSIYLQQRRTQPLALLTTFDAPVMDVNCERRPSSTVAGQSLMLMNSSFAMTQSRRVADKIQQQAAAAAITVPISPEWEQQINRVRPWSYGFGRVDDATQRTEFTALPHWTGSQWQAGPTLPDPQHGYVLLHAHGGHPGKPPAWAIIRRWTAPADLTLAVAGDLSHGSENGDGVRGRVVSSRQGVLGDWTIHNGAIATTVPSVSVVQGETLDFVVDCREHETSDSFSWPVTLTSSGPVSLTFSSVNDFRGPTGPSLLVQAALAWRTIFSRDWRPDEQAVVAAFIAQQLSTLQQMPAAAKATQPPSTDEQLVLINLCQQLLSSNEFLYVD